MDLPRAASTGMLPSCSNPHVSNSWECFKDVDCTIPNMLSKFAPGGGEKSELEVVADVGRHVRQEDYLSQQLRYDFLKAQRRPLLCRSQGRGPGFTPQTVGGCAVPFGSAICRKNDEATSVVFDMPNEGIKLGGVDKDLPLQRIAHEVVRLSN